MDWIKTGWGDNMSPVFNPNIPMTFDCNSAEITDRPILDIALDAIKRITDYYPPPYTLMLSGGVDSQAMLYFWSRSNVPFETVSFTYNDTYNRHDLITLEKFSKEQNIKINFKNFNMFDFLENHLDEYAFGFQCTSPQICSYMRMSEEITQGTVLFSGNFVLPKVCPVNYTQLGLFRYSQTTKRNFIPFFLLHDRELAPTLARAYSQILDTYSITQVTTASKFSILYEEKIKLYKQFGIPVIPQRDKFSGFELVKNYYDSCGDRITAKEKLQPRKPVSARRNFDLLFRTRFEKDIKYVDKLKYLFDLSTININS